MRWVLGIMIFLLAAQGALADEPRARDLGIPFDGDPGPLNAITDVAGVTVGHATVIEDLADGRAARTGVTAVLPRGEVSLMRPVFGAWFALNGNGEMTGTTWLEESGQLEGPVGPDATVYYWSNPVVAETWDDPLNDINGFHVKPEQVAAALEGAATGPVAEGNVGAGTGTSCYDFKCGIGTASREVDVLGETYTVGVLVQANHGSDRRDELRIAGVPVGRHLPGQQEEREADTNGGSGSSIIIVIATDAPLLPHQLKRFSKRAALGLARTGSVADNGSGDIFIAFSTADESLGRIDTLLDHHSIPDDELDPLFAATVPTTEEAIVNSMVAARDMIGNRGSSAKALPHDALIEVMKQYGHVDRSAR
jgi:D-aminopeptidase